MSLTTITSSNVDDNEDELENNELTVEDTDRFHLAVYFLAPAIYRR